MTKTAINDIQLLYEGLNENSPFPAAAHGSNFNPDATANPLKGPRTIGAPPSKVAAPHEGPAMNTDEELENIARDVLGLKTLKARHDDLDFVQIHVSKIKTALQQAFQAGQLSSN